MYLKTKIPTSAMHWFNRILMTLPIFLFLVFALAILLNILSISVFDKATYKWNFNHFIEFKSNAVQGLLVDHNWWVNLYNQVKSSLLQAIATTAVGIVISKLIIDTLPLLSLRIILIAAILIIPTYSLNSVFIYLTQLFDISISSDNLALIAKTWHNSSYLALVISLFLPQSLKNYRSINQVYSINIIRNISLTIHMYKPFIWLSFIFIFAMGLNILEPWREFYTINTHANSFIQGFVTYSFVIVLNLIMVIFIANAIKNIDYKNE